MNRAAVIKALRRYDAALRENGATGLFMFGSRARGTHRPDSDLDLFIDYDPATRVPSMFRLMEIEENIAKDLGVPVTITTRNALHPLMRTALRKTLSGFSDAEGSNHRHSRLLDGDRDPARYLGSHVTRSV